MQSRLQDLQPSRCIVSRSRQSLNPASRNAQGEAPATAHLCHVHGGHIATSRHRQAGSAGQRGPLVLCVLAWGRGGDCCWLWGWHGDCTGCCARRPRGGTGQRSCRLQARWWSAIGDVGSRGICGCGADWMQGMHAVHRCRLQVICCEVSDARPMGGSLCHPCV